MGYVRLTPAHPLIYPLHERFALTTYLLLGDAPIRYATVNMFYDTELDVERMCAMNYYHSRHVPNDCPCVP